ncbi:MAG: hypothetical protein V1846_01755 [Candidatus Komeilibacteria bacterium]
MKGFTAVVLILLTMGMLLLMGISSCSRWKDYKTGCQDYLKLAADAPSVEMAEEFLTKAVSYADAHGLTAGNSAYFWQTPSNDVGIWYRKMKRALKTASEIIERSQSGSGSLTQLEKDNALIKIRQTLIDEGQSVTVTEPQHITVFPLQWLFQLGWLATGLLLVLAIFAVKIWGDD